MVRAVARCNGLLSAMSVSLLLGVVYLISEKDLIRNPGNQEMAECSRGIVGTRVES